MPRSRRPRLGKPVVHNSRLFRALRFNNSAYRIGTLGGGGRGIRDTNMVEPAFFDVVELAMEYGDEGVEVVAEGRLDGPAC